MNQELIDFCTYVQPIVNASGGFIKNSGYITCFPGYVVLMSNDETFCTIIEIPIVFNIYMTAEINRFLSLKTPEEQSNLFDNIYFTGYNVKDQHAKGYFCQYKTIDTAGKCVYSEDDCRNIPGFEDSLGSSDIQRIIVSDGSKYYMLPAGKAVVPLTKSDSASLKIYNCIYYPESSLKTIRYRVYKKKFKVNVDIYCNILTDD